MQVTASHILVPDLATATFLKEQVDSGQDFADLAKQHSRCPSGNNGGNLGAFGRGMMVPAFEQAAFDLPVGGLSGPVQTQFGFHLIKRTA